MARRLPWKTSNEASNKAASTSTTPSKQSPHVKTPDSPASTRPLHVRPTPISKKPRGSRNVLQAANPGRIRSPSTSPPPEPPKEEFMISGLLNDDRYRMVEDEFLATAQLFTTHLHHAEYNRLKSLVKAHNAAAIEEIERPTVGVPTMAARMRLESVKRAQKRRKILDKSDDHDGDGDDDAASGGAGGRSGVGSSLQGLMGSPKREARMIASTIPRTATTKASARYGSEMMETRVRPGITPHRQTISRRPLPPGDDDGETDTDSGEDDLDTPSSRLGNQRFPHVRKASATNTGPSSLSRDPSTNTPSRPSQSSRPASSIASVRNQSGTHASQRKPAQVIQIVDDDGDDDIFGINKRRLHRQKSREQNLAKAGKGPLPVPKARSPDAMPSFL